MSKKSVSFMSVGGQDYPGGWSNFLSFADKDKSNFFDDFIQIDWGNCYADNRPDISDYVIPDFRHFSKAPKFHLVTHDHSDHLAGIFHSVLRGEIKSPIVLQPTTLSILQKDLETHGYHKKVMAIPAYARRTLNIAGWSVTPFEVSHSTNACFGYLVGKGGKRMLHMGDFKMDQSSLISKTDVNFLSYIGKTGGVDLLMVDTAGSLLKKYKLKKSITKEKNVRKDIKRLIEKNKKNRVVTTVYGGYIDMIANIAYVAAKQGRDLIITSQVAQERLETMAELGRSLEDIIQDKSGNNGFKIFFGHEPAAWNLPNHKTVVITDGGLGDPASSLGMALEDKDHPIQFDGNDRFIVTGRSMDYGSRDVFHDYAMKMEKKGTRFYYFAKDHMIGSYGHAPLSEIEELIELVKPKAVAFTYGTREMLSLSFNRIALGGKFPDIDFIKPKDSHIYQVEPYLKKPVLDLSKAQKWIDVHYQSNPAVGKKPVYKQAKFRP